MWSLGHIRLTFDTQMRCIRNENCEVLHTVCQNQPGTPMALYAQRSAPFEEYLKRPLAVLKRPGPCIWRRVPAGRFLANYLRFGANTQLAYMNATSSGGWPESRAGYNG